MDNKEYKFNCDRCNYSTNYKSVWDRHIETTLHKTGKRKTRSDKKIKDAEKCPHCFYTCTQSVLMKHHIISAHTTNDEDKKTQFTFFCDLCKVGALQQATFNKHLCTLKHKKMIEYHKNDS